MLHSFRLGCDYCCLHCHDLNSLETNRCGCGSKKRTIPHQSQNFVVVVFVDTPPPWRTDTHMEREVEEKKKQTHDVPPLCCCQRCRLVSSLLSWWWLSLLPSCFRSISLVVFFVVCQCRLWYENWLVSGETDSVLRHSATWDHVTVGSSN